MLITKHMEVFTVDENDRNGIENKEQKSDNDKLEISNENSQHTSKIENETSEENTPYFDNNSQMRFKKNGTVTWATNARAFLTIGWICAALTAFVSPFFALAGIAFGSFANRQSPGSGNIIIITNIVLAAINILFGLFLIIAVKRAIFGY